MRKHFPETKIRFLKETSPKLVVAELEILSLMTAGFCDGDAVTVEAEGLTEVLAVEIFRVAWRILKTLIRLILPLNLLITKRLAARLFASVDEAFPQFAEQCLEPAYPGESGGDDDVECQVLAYLNDRLHNLTVPVLPALAGYFNCGIELRFDTKMASRSANLDLIRTSLQSIAFSRPHLKRGPASQLLQRA
jgi:hypothetical protein